MTLPPSGPGVRAHAEFMRVWEEGYVADPISYEAMHTRVLLVVDGSAIRTPDGQIDRSRIVARLRQAAESIDVFRLRLMRGVLGLTPPAWVPDDRFDLDRHVSFADTVGTLTVSSFDSLTAHSLGPMSLRHPLWRVRVTELDDGDVAIGVLLHHASADGLGAMKIITALTDTEADSAPRARAGGLPPHARPPRSAWGLPLIALRQWRDQHTSAAAAWSAYSARPFRRRVRRVGARLLRPLRAARAGRADVRARELPPRHTAFVEVDATTTARHSAANGGTIGDLLVAAAIRAAGPAATGPRVTVRVPLSERDGLDDRARNRVRDLEVAGSCADDLRTLTSSIRAQIESRQTDAVGAATGRQIGYVTVVPWRSRARYFCGARIERVLPFPAGMPRDELSAGGLLYDGRITIAATAPVDSDVEAIVANMARDATVA